MQSAHFGARQAHTLLAEAQMIKPDGGEFATCNKTTYSIIFWLSITPTSAPPQAGHNTGTSQIFVYNRKH